ncbi:hypothetical protein ABWI01_03440 [Oceanicaulis alexandrii]|uniref:hypothetical protein n=1 Tax=Oceanicaulis alexandrii TaxID=153233 RepID=UPI0035CF6B5B
MARPVAEIEADLQKYRARLDALLDPDRADRMKHGDREFSRGSGKDLEQSIRNQISLLERELARAQGRRGLNRPVGV